jgi:hypothetical protein
MVASHFGKGVYSNINIFQTHSKPVSGVILFPGGLFQNPGQLE